MAKHFLQVDISELENFIDDFSELREQFDDEIKHTIKVVAREFIYDVIKRTPKKTSNLRKHWLEDNVALHVETKGDEYCVYLVNKAEYASYVEQGHYSYNQFNVGGEPYIVKNRTVEYYEGNNAPTFVYGVFYLKKTEIDYKKDKMETIVSREISKIFKDKGW